jgi:oligopeptidase B
MLDDTIPLTTGEYEEWGNPNDKKYYDYMKSYSPYDNVRQLAYPTILVTTGINDSQVGYWEPTKWVLKLRENSIAKNPIVFKINLDVGHGGASGRSDRYMERAFEMAFMLDQLGIKQ